MEYTIKQAASMLGIQPSTLRYYDKEGLLPLVQRSESGYRVFDDNSIMMLRLIECLKKTGMPIKEIKQFSKWVQMGDKSLEQRYEMFKERKKIVKQQMEDLQQTLDLIDYKCWYYRTAVKAGTESIHFKSDAKKQTVTKNTVSIKQ